MTSKTCIKKERLGGENPTNDFDREEEENHLLDKNTDNTPELLRRDMGGDLALSSLAEASSVQLSESENSFCTSSSESAEGLVEDKVEPADLIYKFDNVENKNELLPLGSLDRIAESIPEQDDVSETDWGAGNQSGAAWPVSQSPAIISLSASDSFINGTTPLVIEDEFIYTYCIFFPLFFSVRWAYIFFFLVLFFLVKNDNARFQNFKILVAMECLYMFIFGFPTVYKDACRRFIIASVYKI